MGSILSLNPRHHNFDPEGVDSALKSNADAVRLSYFEHGPCRWSMAAELPADCRCPRDSVAGLWIPDTRTLEPARNYGGSTRRHLIRKCAREARKLYTQWCNGEEYGYKIECIACSDACDGQSEMVGSCWGFYGLDECRSDVRAALKACSSYAGAPFNDHELGLYR